MCDKTDLMQSEPHTPLGATLLHRRFLEHRGWSVRLVPYYEFELLADSEERAEYMQRR